MSGASIRIYDVGDGRLHLRWFCPDSGLWHEILDSFKSRFPTHHDRSFSARTKTWSVPARYYSRLAEWADDWFDEQDQEWLDEEWAGSGEYSRTYSRSGYGQYSRPQTSASTVEAAFATLHLLPSAPPEVAQAAHRAMLRLTHPDSGGTHEQAVAVNLAWEAIQADRHAERRAS